MPVASLCLSGTVIGITVVLSAIDTHSYFSGLLLVLTSFCFFVADRYGWLCFNREHKRRVYFLRFLFSLSSVIFILAFIVSLLRFFLIRHSSLVPSFLLPTCSLFFYLTIRSSKYRPPPTNTNVLNPLAKSPVGKSPVRSLNRTFSINPSFGFFNTHVMFQHKSRKRFFRIRDSLAPFVFVFIFLITHLITILMAITALLGVYHRPSCIYTTLPYSFTLVDERGAVGSLLCSHDVRSEDLSSSTLIMPPLESTPHVTLPIVDALASRDVVTCVIDPLVDDKDRYTHTVHLSLLSTALYKVNFTRVVSLGSASMYSIFTYSIGLDSFAIEGISPLKNFGGPDSITNSLQFNQPRIFQLLNSLAPFLVDLAPPDYMEPFMTERDKDCSRAGFLDMFRMSVLSHMLPQLYDQRTIAAISIRELDECHGASFTAIGGRFMKDFVEEVVNGKFVDFEFDSVYDLIDVITK
ncbi:hypothetical protein P9112_010320 [Eukaryota sp. TZLM1-RC]